jgi:hypothetical protein
MSDGKSAKKNDDDFFGDGVTGDSVKDVVENTMQKKT